MRRRVGAAQQHAHPPLAAERSDACVQVRLAESGTDPAREVEAYVSRFNRAVTDASDGMTITAHMCHGNFKWMWITQGSYEFVA